LQSFKLFVPLLLALLSAPLAAQEPVETFAALPSYEAPVLSPDGQYVASKAVISTWCLRSTR